MRTKITGKNITITEPMKEKANEKFAFLEKFVRDTDKITLTVSKRKNKIKMATVVSYDGKLVKIEREVDDFYTGLDILAEKLKNTILRQHEFKVKQAKSCERMFEETEEEVIETEIATKKDVSLEPLTVHEAIELMETRGYDFFMFSNTEEDDHPSVVYRRHDGAYGLLNGIV